jgi:ABC-type sugar transport system ATPase subunit
MPGELLMDIAIKATNITKTFPGVRALTDVSIEIAAGETHSVVGENGAGKSTLMKIFGGLYIPDTGDLEVAGEKMRFRHPGDSQRAGIAVIYQEFNLMDELSVAENIFVNRLPKKRGFIDHKTLNSITSDLLDKLDLPLNARELVGSLTVAEKQMTEIAKAVSLDASVIIMDEPTAALNDAEVNRLYRIIANLKASGKTILYISHRMKEIFDVSDRVTVLRDGKVVGTAPIDELDEDAIVHMMVGRDVETFYQHPSGGSGETVFKAESLSAEPSFRNISFEVGQGEILGLAGLMGCGREELCQALYGLIPLDSGTVSLNGVKVNLNNPAKAMKSGIAYVTEDRKDSGIFPLMGIKDNLTINALPDIGKAGGFWIPPAGEKDVLSTYTSILNMKYSEPNQKVRNLSGGNQQKAVLGRALARSCRVLILLEPTRGIDVGTKGEIYELLDKLTRDGLSVILVSSDLPELIALSHRVIVIRDGAIAGMLTDTDIEENAIMKIATGAEVSV